MNLHAWLPLLVVASSLLPGLVIFFLREGSHGLRAGLNLAGAGLKLVLVGLLIWGVFHERAYETRWTLAPGLDLVLHADTLSVLFVSLSSVLWLVTTVYAIGYLESSPHRSRFFGFFSLCVSATVGLALAGNLFTFLIFYELLTLATYPLVAHRGTPEALRGCAHLSRLHPGRRRAAVDRYRVAYTSSLAPRTSSKAAYSSTPGRLNTIPGYR